MLTGVGRKNHGKQAQLRLRDQRRGLVCLVDDSWGVLTMVWIQSQWRGQIALSTMSNLSWWLSIAIWGCSQEYLAASLRLHFWKIYVTSSFIPAKPTTQSMVALPWSNTSLDSKNCRVRSMLSSQSCYPWLVFARRSQFCRTRPIIYLTLYPASRTSGVVAWRVVIL